MCPWHARAAGRSKIFLMMIASWRWIRGYRFFKCDHICNIPRPICHQEVMPPAAENETRNAQLLQLTAVQACWVGSYLNVWSSSHDRCVQEVPAVKDEQPVNVTKLENPSHHTEKEPGLHHLVHMYSLEWTMHGIGTAFKLRLRRTIPCKSRPDGRYMYMYMWREIFGPVLNRTLALPLPMLLG